jgi:hypothetical protein
MSSRQFSIQAAAKSDWVRSQSAASSQGSYFSMLLDGEHTLAFQWAARVTSFQ